MIYRQAWAFSFLHNFEQMLLKTQHQQDWSLKLEDVDQLHQPQLSWNLPYHHHVRQREYSLISQRQP